MKTPHVVFGVLVAALVSVGALNEDVRSALQYFGVLTLSAVTLWAMYRFDAFVRGFKSRTRATSYDRSEL